MEQPAELSDQTTTGRPVSAMDGTYQRAGQSPRLLLTVEEAADRIGICRSNMFKLIRQGDVKSVKVGRLRRITPAALEDYVRQLSASADSAA